MAEASEASDKAGLGQGSPLKATAHAAEGLKEAASMGQRRGVLAGSAFTFVYCIGLTVTMPFLQSRRDELGCDALCNGSQQSLRSALGLLGAIVLGRLSDKAGRRPVLVLGILGNLASLMLGLAMDSLKGMWLALVPAALLNQNFATTRALFTDYFPGKSHDTERSGAIGWLGMAMGFAMMAGSGLGSSVASNYREALFVGAVVTLSSCPLIALLPAPSTVAQSEKPRLDGFWSWASMPILRTSGARMLVFLRISMALAFWLFYAIWTPSLHRRFGFGPAEHGRFMAFVGLVYAVAQGVIAKPLIRATAGEGDRCDPTLLLCACLVVLALGRIGALLTADVRVVYLLFGSIVVALGVANILISTAVGRLAGARGETGGLYGVLEACESAAGMVGPAMGGLLARAETSLGVGHLVLGTVVLLYAVSAVVVAFRYRSWIVVASADALHSASEEATAAKKMD